MEKQDFEGQKLDTHEYAQVQERLGKIAEGFLARLESPSFDKVTIIKLAKMIEGDIQFVNHGPGIKTLAEQTELYLEDPRAAVSGKSTDCKLPVAVFGIAAQKLRDSSGLSNRILFGLSNYVHPHVYIELKDEDGPSYFLDVDYNNVSPEALKARREKEAANVAHHDDVTEETPESAGNRHVSGRTHPPEIDRYARRIVVPSYMHDKSVDVGVIEQRLNDEEYKFLFYTPVGDSNFFKILDDSFLEAKFRER